MNAKRNRKPVNVYRTRAERRHYAERFKERTRRIVKQWASYGGVQDGEALVNHMHQNRQMCSCPGCGNPRRHFGKKTMQERRNEYTEETDDV